VNPTLDAFLRSWPFDPWLSVALLLTGWVYWRGWSALHRRDPSRWHGGQLAAFLGGLAAIFLALASPIEPFAGLLLQVHMLQHLLLMMVAPPLLWLGEPLFPLLRGLPRPIRTYWIAPLFRSRSLGSLFRWLTHPLVALLLFTATTWLWHAPVIYDLAVREGGWWHHLQHLCFLATALLFWYPVVRPYPCQPHWSLWLLFPYLLLADIQNTILSALLTFSDRVLYPFYNEVPRLGSVSALDDQAAAGVLMWVPGSVVFLVPLFWIALRLLYGPTGERRGVSPPWKHGSLTMLRSPQRLSLPLVGTPPTTASFDLLRVPVLGRFLRWRHARLALQVPLALVAGILIYDGLRGPQLGPMNLAGVLPWVHWRGLLILALLAAGNLFCMGCPFLLPRTLARRWLPGGRSWPRPLRSKWLAVALLALFLWAYEAFSLWDSPWLTAWIIVGYFVAALVIDGFFRGAAFCKYVCPIGQFNFVQSLASPLEVKVRDPEVCARCRTKDCIRGRDGIPGCELHLYQPRKRGNMDCTFCLDCVHACPHDNIGMIAGPPGRGLWSDGFRSGVGRFGQRPDLAALVVVLVFGAFANAAGMVGPVAEWQERWQVLLGQRSPFLGVTLFYLFALLLLPLLAVGLAALLSRWGGRLPSGWLRTATRFSYALLPLGFGMWLAHYSFHLLTSYDTAVPVVQRFALEAGWGLGQPAWLASCCRPVAEWLPRLEILFLDVGLLLSLYVAYRIALAETPQRSRAVTALLPWAVLLVLLFAAGVWIVLQPMQMRGTIPG
jgi:cytochrome c oxidase assembly factor CtaG